MRFNSKDVARFLSKVDRSGVCHLWTAAKYPSGYGCFGLNRHRVVASRLAYEIAHGEDSAEGWLVLHDCPGGDNPSCVNPAHLRLGTYGDNARDTYAKGRPPNRPLGDRNGSRKHPERLPRGDGHVWRAHPERRPRGESSGTAKMTDAEVTELRRLRDEEGWTFRRLADRYGINATQACRIARRLSWKHLP
jgi:hypothetical protein